jgi:hypothetical protein
MPNREITIAGSELRATVVAMSIAIGLGGLGVALLLRLLQMSPPLAMGFAFVVMAAIWYLPARLFCRLHDYDLRLSRYALVWLTTIVVITALQFLVR